VNRAMAAAQISKFQNFKSKFQIQIFYDG
jgi:hypothetical protein